MEGCEEVRAERREGGRLEAWSKEKEESTKERGGRKLGVMRRNISRRKHVRI